VWNARNKAIFYKKVEGYTYEEIAEEYNLSTQQIKAIVKDCINRISKHI
jgi:Mor family transcriptional regulator